MNLDSTTAVRAAPKRDDQNVSSIGGKLLAHALFLGITLGSWELVSGWLINPFWVSKPSLIAKAMVMWFSTASFWTHFGVTMLELFVGFLAGAVAGVLTGFVFGEWRRVGDFMDPYMAALYGVPKTALAPLFILWFGIGLGSKFVMAGIMVFFLVFFNTMAGLRAVDVELINMARVAGATRTQILTNINFPSAFPYLMTGIRVGLPTSLIGVIVAEFLASNRGIGYLIVKASMFFDTAETFAGIIILAMVVFALNEVLVRVERYVLRWRPQSQ